MGTRRFLTLVMVAALVLLMVPAAATGHDAHDPGEHGAGAAGGADESLNMKLLSAQPTGAVNSDIAFWGDRAFVGNYNGFRVFDISATKPKLLVDYPCFGPQNDPSVWDRDGDGQADLLVLSVDRTLAGPECGAPAVDHDDPTGWEGLRLFDVSDPTNPQFITGVYQDCGSHTNTLLPQPEEGRLLVLNSSYPLRPGPTCGPVRGPEAGRDPLHGVVQVVEIPLEDPASASELAELPIDYPGDPDNRFTPSEHGLVFEGMVDGMRACHDIAVFTAIGLVAGACAEQAQVWRIGADGLPDTADPLWVFDRVNVDFWHSATFSWDGRIVNFIDESFGDGCPTRTTKTAGLGEEREYETGNMFFLDVASGELLSEFRIGRATEGDPIPYCSSHLGNVVPSTERYLLVNAYYRGGTSVIDFTDPTNPTEIAFHDRANADTWSAYWYENTPAPQGSSMAIYANDGVHDPATGAGFETFKAFVGPTKRVGLTHLNPQVQEQVIPLEPRSQGQGQGRGPRR